MNIQFTNLTLLGLEDEDGGRVLLIANLETL